jgi:ribosomal protein S13
MKVTPRKPEGNDFLIREIAVQDDKKLKNALREALVMIDGKTKRSAKERIEKLGISEKLMEKKISEMNLNNILEILKRFENA